MTDDCSITKQGFLKAARVGVENAARAIEMLVPGGLAMDVLWTGSAPTPQLCEIVGSPETVVIGAYVRVTGESQGDALFIFSKRSALIMADLVMGQPVGTTAELDEMGESLIQEVANILTASYLSAISDHYGVILLPDPPLLTTDMAAAIVDSILIGSGHYETETLSIATRFRSQSETLEGFFIYIPDDFSCLGREAA